MERYTVYTAKVTGNFSMCDTKFTCSLVGHLLPSLTWCGIFNNVSPLNLLALAMQVKWKLTKRSRLKCWKTYSRPSRMIFSVRLQPLAQFMVQCTMCMSCRSDTNANICSDQEDSHDVDSKAKKKNMFKCVC
jgi:hypothetical protein